MAWLSIYILVFLTHIATENGNVQLKKEKYEVFLLPAVQRVLDSGVGSLRDVRPTDLDEKAGRRRYQIFREHYSTLLRLKEFFPFHLIDSMGTLSECREQIEMELQYQSALELEATTFRAISHIPLAADIAKLARQNMVTRLDSYEKHDHHLFADVIHLISKDLVPIIRRCALSGIAVYNTERSLFFAHPGNRNGSMGEVTGRLIRVGAPWVGQWQQRCWPTF